MIYENSRATYPQMFSLKCSEVMDNAIVCLLSSTAWNRDPTVPPNPTNSINSTSKTSKNFKNIKNFKTSKTSNTSTI